MKNLTSYLKFLLLPVLNSLAFICSFYLSIVFFLIVIVNEALNGRPNEILKEDFSTFIQKLLNLPETLISPKEKREMPQLAQGSK